MAVSSEAGGASVGGEGGAASTEQPAKKRASLVPHLGKVYLDQGEQGEFVLSNSETGEAMCLEPGIPWELHLDDDGYAYIFDSASIDPEPIPVESRFKFNIFESSEQRQLLVWDRPEQQGSSHAWLDELRSQFVETTLTIYIGAARSPMKMTMYALKFPRKSAKLVVALKDLYSGMHLTQFGGHSWMWIDGSKRRWHSTFVDYGFGDHFIGSSMSKTQIDGEDGFLPAQSVSLQGVILLLARWSWSSCRFGGFKELDHRKAAESIMEGISRAVLPKGGEDIYWAIDLVEDWSPPHPRPLVFINKVILRISSDGSVDLALWRAKAAALGERSFPALALGLLGGDGVRGHIPFLTLLRKGQEQAELRGVHKQLVWRTGVRLQELALEVMREDSEVEGMLVQPVDWCDVFEIYNKLDPRLVRYCLAAKRVSRGHTIIGLCADKAACGGFTLQAGVLSLPDNTGIVPPPQVTASFDCVIESALGASAGKDAKKNLRDRHIAWVRRGIGGNFVSWKQQKRHRVAAKHVVENIDNQDMALYTFWVLMVVTYNCPAGPMNDRVRWQELAESWDRMFKNLQPAECVLFTEKADEILKQRGGVASLGGEGDDLHERLWQDLRGDPPFVVGQQKTNIAKFFNSTHRAKAELSRWDTVLLNMEYLALETGLLSARKLDKLNFKEPAHENDEVARDADRPGRPQVDERLLRTSCQNAVEVGVYMLSEPEHKHWVNIVLAAGAPTEQWHRLQNKRLRSVQESKQWMIDQLDGQFAAHLHDTWGQLRDEPTLKDCGLQCRQLGATADALQVVAQDDLADLLGTGVISMVFRRQMRSMWAFRGWPVRMVGLLGPAPLMAKTMADFREDLASFTELQTHPAQTAEVRALLRRSVFTHRSVLQYVEAVRESNFQTTDALLKLVSQRSASVISSQCSEDLFNSAKNSRLTKGKVNYRRPEKSYAAMLSQHIVDQRHEYKEVVPDAALSGEAVALAKEVFQPRREDCSLNLDKLASTKAKTEWYSSTAGDLGRIHADLQIMRDLRQSGGHDKLENAFLSRLFNCKHKMMVQKVDGGQWYFVGGNWGDTAALLWPAIKVSIEGHPAAMVFEPNMRDGSDFTLVTVTSLDGWRAVPFRWRSPWWQHVNWPRARSYISPAVRAVADGQTSVQTLLVVAAQAGFWDLDLSFVKSLAGLRRLALPVGASLCEALQRLISDATGCSDSDALGFMKHRIARMATANRYMSEFLEVDEINDVIDHHDKQAVDQHKKSAAASIAAERSFAQEFSSKVRSCRTASQPPNKKRKSGKEVNTVPLDTALSQKDAKQYLPPGGKIWVDKFGGSWQGHLGDPFPRIGRSFRKWTEQGALKEVLRGLWRQYCTAEGIPLDECPMGGLFETGGGGASNGSGSAAAAPAASASSGSGGAAARLTARA